MRPASERQWLPTLLLACLVAGAIFAVIRQSGPPHKPPASQPAPSRPPAVTVVNVGHPLLGITSDWQLFGLSADSIVEVQLKAGRITRTILPPQEGSGPVSFIVGPRQAIIRPLDNVPGYVVPDGRPARPLTGLLARGDLLLPGPSPAEEWAVSGSGNTLPLLGPSGQATSVRLTLPRHWPAQSAMADGRGDVLLFDDHGQQFDAGPGSLRPVGALLVAIGPKRWLGLACQHGRCRNVVIDVATGARRTLAGPPVSIVTWPWPWQPGVVSPDGTTAAVIEAGGRGHVFLNLVDLASGVATTIDLPMTQTSSSQMLAWSPDSRWLIVVDAGGQLLAVNRLSHRVESLGVPLPEVTQIAVRPPPG
jgi:hypothetical protein